MRILAFVTLLLLLPAVASTQGPTKPASPAAASPTVPSPLQTFKGDFGEMKKRRVIRVGVAYESLKLFEDQINTGVKSAQDKVHVVFFLMSRDEMAAALLEGRVDLLAVNLTITP